MPPELARCFTCQAKPEPKDSFDSALRNFPKNWSEAIDEVLDGKVLPPSAKWLLLYAEAREFMCSCNKTDTPELGPEYDYTCEWCEEHPEGNWDSVKAALFAAAQSISAKTQPKPEWPEAFEIHNRFCGENGEMCQACKIRSEAKTQQAGSADKEKSHE